MQNDMINNDEIDIEFERLFRERRAATEKASFNISRFIRQVESYTPISEFLVSETLKETKRLSKPNKTVSFSSTVNVFEFEA